MIFRFSLFIAADDDDLAGVQRAAQYLAKHEKHNWSDKTIQLGSCTDPG